MLTGSVFQLFGVVLCYKMGSLCGSFGVSQSASIILSNKMCVNTAANTAWVPGVCASVTVLTFFSRPASSVWMSTISVPLPSANPLQFLCDPHLRHHFQLDVDSL